MSKIEDIIVDIHDNTFLSFALNEFNKSTLKNNSEESCKDKLKKFLDENERRAFFWNVYTDIGFPRLIKNQLIQLIQELYGTSYELNAICSKCETLNIVTNKNNTLLCSHCYGTLSEDDFGDDFVDSIILTQEKIYEELFLEHSREIVIKSFLNLFKYELSNIYIKIGFHLKDSIKCGVCNLLTFGFSHINYIKGFISIYFSDGTNLSPEEGQQNFSYFHNFEIEDELREFDEDVKYFVHCEQPFDKYDHLISIKTKEIDELVRKSEESLINIFHEVNFKNKNKYLDELIEYYSHLYISELSKGLNNRNFYDRKKSKELNYLIEFFDKKNVMLDEIIINEGVNYLSSKASYSFFEPKGVDLIVRDLTKYEVCEIQVNDYDLIQREDNADIKIMLIFQKKELRDELNINLQSLFQKKTKTYESQRERWSNLDWFYLECEIDWKVS